MKHFTVAVRLGSLKFTKATITLYLNENKTFSNMDSTVVVSTDSSLLIQILTGNVRTFSRVYVGFLQIAWFPPTVQTCDGRGSFSSLFVSVRVPVMDW